MNRRPRHFRHFAAQHFIRAFFLLLFAVTFACGGSAVRARPQQTASEAAIAVRKVEPPSWWVGLT
ncbi:MAG TPA: hypothetical protein VGR03_17460, partial [Candidatus Acidoferrum sp.]|nr:hypothetical protein [Candidatus Acidoferrum sp.]